ISGTQTICTNGSTTFASNGDAGGAWTSSNNSVATVGSSSGIVSGVAAGTATITYTVTGTGGCANATATRTVTMNPLPACSITGNATICPSSAGNIYTAPLMSSYSWSISGNGSIIGSTTSQNISVTAGSTCGASFTLTLTITNDNGCQSTCQKIVNV